MAIPETIKKLANDIRTKIYGREVRESLAKGIEEAGDLADKANTKSENAVYQVNNIQAQVNQLVVEGDSSVETAQARVDAEGNVFTTLKERLDTKETQFANEIGILKSSVIYPEFFGASPTATPSENRQALQQALDVGGYIYLGTPGTYLIDNTLYIGDDTALELAEGVIIKLAPGSNCNMLKNKDTTNRNKNITLIGGTWDYDHLNQNTGGDLKTMAIFFTGVDNITFKNMKMKNAKKYCFLICDFTKLTVNDIVFDTYSDGLHMQGPGRDIDIRNLKGTTGDDMISFTIGDFAHYEVSRGDFENVVIDGVYPDQALCALKLAGNAPYKFKNFTAQNIYGTTTASGISIIDDSNLVGTIVEGLTLRNIGIAATGNVIRLNPSQARDITIENYVATGTPSQHIKIEPNAIIESLSINGFRGYDIGISAVFNDGVVKKLSLRNIEAKLQANVPFITNQKQIDLIRMDNFIIEEGLEIISNIIETSSSNLEISMSNGKIIGMQRGIFTRKDLNLRTNNIVFENLGNYVIYTDRAITARVEGNLDQVGTGSLTNIDTTNGTISVNGIGIKVNVQRLKPQDWDVVWNTFDMYPSEPRIGPCIFLGNTKTWKQLY